MFRFIFFTPRALATCWLFLISLTVMLATGPAEITPPASTYIRELAIDSQSPEILYAASTGAGLFKTTDGGEQWRPVQTGAMGTQFYTVKIDPKEPARVMAGGLKTGLWLSADRGETWSTAGLDGVTVLSLAMDDKNPARVFVLAPEGVYRTQDLGRDPWRLVFDYARFLKNNPSKDYPAEPWDFDRFQELALSPHNPNLIFVAARWEGGFHRSDDGGETWSHESISGIFRRVDLVRFDPVDPSIIYAGTHHQGLFKSYNEGRSWVSLSHGLIPQIREPNYAVYLIGGLTVSSTEPGLLYSGSDRGGWKSSDGGLSWQELGRTLTCEFPRCFAIDPRQPGTVYAGTNIGLYKSTDAGLTWSAINRGLPERRIIQTLEVKLDDELFNYAIVAGQPSLYRRSLTKNEAWVAMSWQMYEQADSLRYEALSRTLVISTAKGEFRSTDGGFRWDVPAVEFSLRPSPESPLPGPAPRPRTGFVQLPVQIKGAIPPDETRVDPLYRRPPYVSLQIVGEGYPKDGSTPLWSANWERSLAGYLEIPAALLAGDEAAPLLYVEVRDFQLNLLTGHAVVTRRSEGPLTVEVSHQHLLPAFLGK